VVARVSDRKLMLLGGALAGSCLALMALHFPWQVQAAIFALFGLGFYLLHSCIQVHVTDLSQTARGAAASLHSSSFYFGQAIGPVVYGFGFAHGGPEPTILFGALVVFGVGIMCSQLLRRKT
jgi:predicted MFS family arabinose efflux permease